MVKESDAGVRTPGDTPSTSAPQPGGTLTSRCWRTHLASGLRLAMTADRALFDFVEQRSLSLKRREAEVARELVYRVNRLRLARAGLRCDCVRFAEETARNLRQLDPDLTYPDALGGGMALDLTYSYLSGALSLPLWEQGLRVIEQSGLLSEWPAIAPLTSRELKAVFRGRGATPERQSILAIESFGTGCSVMPFHPELARHVALLLSAWVERTPIPPYPGFN